MLRIAGRYAWSGRLEMGRILDEFVAVTKMHRKHAQRLLRQDNPRQRSAPRPGRRIYDEAAREALIFGLGVFPIGSAANGSSLLCRFSSRRWSGMAISDLRMRFARASSQ